MVLNDKPNCQVSRILMNPRPILSDPSENHPPFEIHQLSSNFIRDSVGTNWRMLI
jgi:hypothetical protein